MLCFKGLFSLQAARFGGALSAYVQIQQSVECNQERNISARPRQEERNEKREKGGSDSSVTLMLTGGGLPPPYAPSAFNRSSTHISRVCFEPMIVLLTSDAGPLSAPGQEKVTNSWQRLWTTKQQTGERERKRETERGLL